MARVQKNHFPVKLRYIILFVLLLALLLAAVGTLAWMRQMRSLQTATLVQVTSLSLEGPNPETPNSAIINLGDIDATVAGHESYVFGVRTSVGKNFQVQLAHTTNNPFTYTIYQAEVTTADNPYVTEDQVSFNTNGLLDGFYLNLDSSSGDAKPKGDNYYDKTYDTEKGIYEYVQKDAAPLYWRSNIVEAQQDVTYYILDVSWSAQPINTKETDMVYLTVGTAIDNQEGGQ